MGENTMEAQRQYAARFGAQILKVYERKVACIRKNRILTYCDEIHDRGESVDPEALREYLQKEMADYEKRLSIMREGVQQAQNSDGDVTASNAAAEKERSLQNALRSYEEYEAQLNAALMQYPENIWKLSQ